MLVESFRIQNYKSIEDTGECWVAAGMTVLAGKNESGKSAILEALRDFSPAVEGFPEEAFPITSSEKPGVALSLRCTESEIAEMLGDNRLSSSLTYLSDNLLKISRIAHEGYALDDDLAALLDKEPSRGGNTDDIRQQVEALATSKATILAAQSYTPGELLELYDTDIEDLDETLLELESLDDEEIRSFAAEARMLIGKIKPELSTSEVLLSAALERLPGIVFFSDFADAILPFEIPINERPSEIAQDLLVVAGLSMDEIRRAGSLHRRMNLLRRHSATITGDFRTYWQQDKVSLALGCEGENLVVEIHEDARDEGFMVEQRSKGFQWFLTFYLRLQARGSHAPNLILIDEPGLFLHAKAQRDLLTVLEDISKESQVVFSTHSSYLIDPDRLDRVRLVIKDATGKPGTTIANKIHAAPGSDHETLTPILAAIGDSMHTYLSASGGTKNILLEGISDYMILQGIGQHLGLDFSEYRFVPCVGAPQIRTLASIFIAWDVPFMAILDNDRAGKQACKVLRDDLFVHPDRVLTVSNNAGDAIEDLFTPGDFRKCFLSELEVETNDKPNSKLLKDYDSVLLAKRFLENSHEGSLPELTSTTKKNFEDLASRIDEAFKGPQLGLAASLDGGE